MVADSARGSPADDGTSREGRTQDRQGPRPRRSTAARAVLAASFVALATLATLGTLAVFGVVGAVGLGAYRSYATPATTASEGDAQVRRAVGRVDPHEGPSAPSAHDGFADDGRSGVGPFDDDDPTASDLPDRSGAAAAPTGAGPAPDAARAFPPRTTRVTRIGPLTVVDVGLEAPALRDVLHREQARAAADGDRLLVMLTGAVCDPCRGVDRALSDPLLRTALASVRLLRVDLHVFEQELDRLAWPSRLYPAFFLIAEDGTPEDAIHGGEWDADIPENMAPVLGRFVRGTYGKRRHPRFTPSTNAIAM
ncbi:MAG: hypothetical protein AAF928_06180 [Myxococcota bacterium]